MTSDLLEMMNVGPRIVGYFAQVGITSRSQLVGCDPEELFEALPGPQDPCLLDTFRSAVDQADGKPARPWWEYSRERR